MAYGKIKADTLVYDNGGSDVEKTVASLAAAAPTASPAFTGTATAANLTRSANLQVNGTTTTVASSTMTVADKNIEIAKGAANDAAADGAGITIDSGDGDKTWNWVDATDAWTSSEHIHLGDNKKLLAGTGSDLSIYHNGTNNYIDTVLSTADFYVRPNKDFYIMNTTSGDVHIKCIKDESVELYENNVKKLETTATGVTVTGDVSDSKGNLRDISYNLNNDNYTLVAADRGKMVGNSVASKTTTIPASVFGTGQVVSILNPSSGDHTIAAGSGFTLINTADAATGNRTLASKGMATVYFTSATEGYISGTGLS